MLKLQGLFSQVVVVRTSFLRVCVCVCVKWRGVQRFVTRPDHSLKVGFPYFWVLWKKIVFFGEGDKEAVSPGGIGPACAACLRPVINCQQ